MCISDQKCKYSLLTDKASKFHCCLCLCSPPIPPIIFPSKLSLVKTELLKGTLYMTVVILLSAVKAGIIIPI